MPLVPVLTGMATAAKAGYDKLSPETKEKMLAGIRAASSKAVDKVGLSKYIDKGPGQLMHVANAAAKAGIHPKVLFGITDERDVADPEARKIIASAHKLFIDAGHTLDEREKVEELSGVAAAGDALRMKIVTQATDLFNRRPTELRETLELHDILRQFTALTTHQVAEAVGLIRVGRNL